MRTNANSFEVLSSRLYELFETELYSKSTVRDMRFILQSLSRYIETYDFKEYTPEIGERFVIHCMEELHICSSRISRAKNITGKLNRLLQGLDGRDALLPDKSKKFELPEDLMRSLTDYLAYCVEKGNRQNTIDYKYWVCGRFLKNLSAMGCAEFRNVTGDHVQTAFLALGFVRYWERIGPFLRFLADSNRLKQDYSGLIQHRRHAMPQPTVYSQEEITSIENSFALSSQSGIRNHAITLLITRYGIRACDVAALTFDDIDFENNRLHFIQQKTGDPWEGELFPAVKRALQSYIKNVRPKDTGCSHVFMTLAPPFAPADSYAINTMIWNQFKRTKINIAERQHGSRAFRSSIASNMLNTGASTEVVRKILGHGTKYALRHYARIDMKSMRLCALSVPEPTGNFAKILSGKGANSCV